MAKKSKEASAATSKSPAATKTWIVHWDSRAVEEFATYREKRVRKAILTSAEFLRQLGDRLTEPHAKPLSGERKLRELRPSGGQSTVRPLYARVSEYEFVIFTIAPESVDDASGFRRAVQRAKDRAKAGFDLDV
jgi:hypothetical protein